MPTLPYAHGNPPLIARIRSQPEDFLVDEVLGFEPCGEGEHVFLHVRKRETNTLWLAKELARFAGVASRAVGYAGLKDRHAVTTQTFTVQLPGQEGPDWSAFPHADVQVLSQARHNRKLKTGALQANRFSLILRDVQGDAAQAEQVLQRMTQHGVPNYFGEQRFGFDGSNVQRARAMFEGKRVDRKTRGLLLSAARSQIFNALLAQRVQAGNWNQALPGEVFCLQGSRSWFAGDGADDLPARLASGDIHPSGPMWGRGDLPTQAEAANLEREAVAAWPDLSAGLEKAGLEQDRRSLRLLPQDLQWQWPQADQLSVSFSLPAGSYATVVLRELASWA